MYAWFLGRSQDYICILVQLLVARFHGYSHVRHGQQLIRCVPPALWRVTETRGGYTVLNQVILLSKSSWNDICKLHQNSISFDGNAQSRLLHADRCGGASMALRRKIPWVESVVAKYANYFCLHLSARTLLLLSLADTSPLHGSWVPKEMNSMFKAKLYIWHTQVYFLFAV